MSWTCSRARTLMSSACFMILFCASASAAEPESQWSGLYLGIHGGWASGQIDDADLQTQARNVFGSLGANSFGTEAWFGGGQFGYNHQFRHVVLGTEFSASGGGGGQSEVCFPNAFASGTNTFTCQADLNWKASWLAKLGLAFGSNDRFVGYATGGLTIAEYAVTKNQINSLNVGPPFGIQDTTTQWSGNATFVGGTLGAGFQYAITGDLSFGVEYLHSEYASSNYTTTGTQHIVCSTFSCGAPFALSPRTATDQLSDDSVRAVLNLRLD